jgi:hypothetical protein
MTPEGKVKRWASDQLEKLLPEARVLYRPPGGAFGKAGEPDLHVTYGGCKGVIEAKVEDAEPTPLQWKRLRDYSKAGALAMVLRGRDLPKLQLFAKLMIERAECLKTIVGQQNLA